MILLHLVEVLAPLLVLSIPIVAILAGTYTKTQKLKYASGNSPENQQKLTELEQENADLKKRVSNLETIVNDDLKWNHHGANNDTTAIEMKSQLEKMRKEIEILKSKK